MRTNILTALSLGFLTACNPSDFNTVGSKAPAVVISPPEGYDADVVGRVVLPLPTPPGSSIAARLLFSATDKQALAVADFDKDGKVSYSVANFNTGLPDLGNAGMIMSAALLPDGQLLVGTPMSGLIGTGLPPGKVSLLKLTEGADGKVGFSSTNLMTGAADGHFGIAVGVGNVSGTGPGEMVVVADQSVNLIPTPGVNIQAACPELRLNNEADPYAHRPIVVGDFLGGPTDEIIVAGLQLGQGRVVVVSYDATSKALLCPKVFSVPGSAHFGASLVAADFNNDGKQDLAVGNPSDSTTLIYFGPLDTKVGPDVTLQGESASDFGQKLAVTTTTPPDLLVSAPMAIPTGRPQVGKVYRFAIGAATGTLPITSAIAGFTVDGGVAGDRFGTSVGELHFNTTSLCPGGQERTLLFASTNYNIFTFFRYPSLDPLSQTDPRCFMQAK